MTTQHVLVFHDNPSVRDLLTTVHEEEGYLVTSVGTMDDALIILRASLHPLVAIVGNDLSSVHPLGSFFEIVRDHPNWYGQHRYVAFHSWDLSETDEALLCELGVTVLRQPFDTDDLLKLVAEAAASLT